MKTILVIIIYIISVLACRLIDRYMIRRGISNSNTGSCDSDDLIVYIFWFIPVFNIPLVGLLAIFGILEAVKPMRLNYLFKKLFNQDL